MDDCVAVLAAAVYGNKKIRVIGWFKPSQDDDGVAVGNFSYHICLLLPNSELTDYYQQSLLYGARAVEYAGDNASTGFSPETIDFPNLDSMTYSADLSSTLRDHIAPLHTLTEKRILQQMKRNQILCETFGNSYRVPFFYFQRFSVLLQLYSSTQNLYEINCSPV